jgi:hypothetical protein
MINLCFALFLQRQIFILPYICKDKSLLYHIFAKISQSKDFSLQKHGKVKIYLCKNMTK